MTGWIWFGFHGLEQTDAGPPLLGGKGAYEERCRVCYDPTAPEQPELGLVGG